MDLEARLAPLGPPLLRGLRWLLALGAASYVLVFLWMAFQRVPYPFELEWMEGAMVDHVDRILQGEPVYVSPTLDYAPFMYAPFYFYLSAVVAAVTGVGFLPLRLISFAATLGSWALIYGLVERDTDDRYAGFLAAGLFAATFDAGGAFHDVARTDSLAVCLMLGSLFVARRSSSLRGAALSGCLLALSFLTKQIAGPLVVPIFLYLALWNWSHALAFGVAFVGLAGGITLAMNAATDGWFVHYVYSLQVGRTVLPNMVAQFVRRDLPVLGGAIVLGVLYLTARVTWRRDLKEASFYLLAVGGVVAAVGYSRSLSLGAFTNVLIPAHAVLAVLFGLGVHEALRSIRSASATTPAYQALFVPFFLVAGWQFASLAYKPSVQVPTQADVEAGEELVELMRSVDGEIFMPAHGWLPRLAGKHSCIHLVALRDVMAREPEYTRLKEELIAALRSHRYAALLLDSDWGSERWFMHEVLANYEAREENIFESGVVFWPRTGSPMRPRKIFFPKE